MLQIQLKLSAGEVVFDPTVFDPEEADQQVEGEDNAVATTPTSAARLYAIVPPGVKGGDVLALEDEHGEEHVVVLPTNLNEGDKFCYVVPPRQPAASKSETPLASTFAAAESAVSTVSDAGCRM